jgi:hypothetical protein
MGSHFLLVCTLLLRMFLTLSLFIGAFGIPNPDERFWGLYTGVMKIIKI